MTEVDGFLRHLRAATCILPAGRLAFCLGAARVGWVTARAAALLGTLGCVPQDDAIVLPDAADLTTLVGLLAAQGEVRLRGEAFDVRAAPDTAPLATIDRGALPWFGIQAEGVHVNGLVRKPDGMHLWVARRAADKLLDPGKLDHIVAGGVAAGQTPDQTVLKEAAEEAGMAPALSSRARHVGIIGYAMLRPEGLRRDRLHCYDLDLPDDFTPVPQDGEVAAFELWHISQVLRTVAETDQFKFNVNLVLIDLFVRLGLIPPLENPLVA